MVEQTQASSQKDNQMLKNMAKVGIGNVSWLQLEPRAE
jgi:hypothetical protein